MFFEIVSMLILTGFCICYARYKLGDLSKKLNLSEGEINLRGEEPNFFLGGGL